MHSAPAERNKLRFRTYGAATNTLFFFYKDTVPPGLMLFTKKMAGAGLYFAIQLHRSDIIVEKPRMYACSSSGAKQNPMFRTYGATINTLFIFYKDTVPPGLMLFTKKMAGAGLYFAIQLHRSDIIVEKPRMYAFSSSGAKQNPMFRTYGATINTLFIFYKDIVPRGLLLFP
ncbi:MAG: hypothetical protein IPM42_12150 [Saprospiraceae bacterium]|nr:hypothetical protein [Saprospiraceae bacterium]